jgi:hypothetical protein
MIRLHDIKWYLEDPTRLTLMKPFTRGGKMKGHGWELEPIFNNTIMDTGFCNLELTPISQDTYITEYRPDLHHILLNQSIPHIKVSIDGTPLDLGMMDMTQTCSFQKLIHAAHVRSLTANPLEFNLGKSDAKSGGIDLFESVKDEWSVRNMDWWMAQAINTCKQLGNCGLLFSFDHEANRYMVTNYSYEDGYQIVPNYDEYGFEIARSLVYQIDGRLVIDTYDNKKHYRCVQGSDNKAGWDIQDEPHGFSRCPLLIKRGKVAWEYAESSCEMWELMVNIQNIALKRFGTFALVFTGEMDKDSFKRDSSTLIINLSSDTTNGKQSADVLKFPEPTTMNDYLKTLEEKISLFSSTSFITPKDITATNSGGNGIALAMSNDYALATQSAIDWRRFVNDMVYLHQEGLDMENNGVDKYAKLRIGAKIVPWSLETNNTKITNLAMEAKWLSMKTIIEKSPDAAPDEIDRIIEERGALIPQGASDIDEGTDKAQRLSTNRSNVIVDNNKKE